jgi:hypothetical protein
VRRRSRGLIRPVGALATLPASRARGPATRKCSAQRRCIGGAVRPIWPLPHWRAAPGATTCKTAGQLLRKQEGSLSPYLISSSWAPPMAMTATERSRVLRERRASGKVVLTVVVTEDELAEIARAGYRGGLDGSQRPGSSRQPVPQRRCLGADAMTASDGFVLNSSGPLSDRPGKTMKSARNYYGATSTGLRFRACRPQGRPPFIITH